MPVTTSYKKCPKCNTTNIDTDICKNCGEILSYKKKQELREQKMREEQITKLKEATDNPNFVERMKKHPFFLVRILGYMLYSVVVVVSVIGGGLAWLTAMVMGG